MNPRAAQPARGFTRRQIDDGLHPCPCCAGVDVHDPDCDSTPPPDPREDPPE